MSRPRDPWWPYIKNVLRAYPALQRELNARRQMSVTVHYNKAGGGSGPGRMTETAALRELNPQRQREYEAVRKAIRKTGTLPDGKHRNDLIRLVYFRKRYNLRGAAWACHVSERTAQRWNGEFIRMVADYLGLQ